MSYKRFLALVGALIVLSMTLGAGAVYVGVSANRNTCRQVNVVQAEIADVLHRQQRAIASNAYYKQHPQELIKAQQEIMRELQTFAPLKC